MFVAYTLSNEVFQKAKRLWYLFSVNFLIICLTIGQKVVLYHMFFKKARFKISTITRDIISLLLLSWFLNQGPVSQKGLRPDVSFVRIKVGTNPQNQTKLRFTKRNLFGTKYGFKSTPSSG